MRDFRSVLNVIGILLCIESIAMSIPMFTDIFYGNSDWQTFFFISIITFFIGLVLYFSFRNQVKKIRIREAFFLTILSWIVIAFFSSLPFVYSSSDLSYTDALFESISGITTTGATVIINLDELNEGILIWRSLLQWFGGIGIIVIALAILPTLQIGGMQLLHMEHDDPYEKTLPKINQFIFQIFIIYLLATLTCAILYYFFGMNAFDAIAHSLTTISTGGFSTYNSSLSNFNSVNIEIICITFMIIGSLPFVVYLKFLHGNLKSIFQDEQIKVFFYILIFSILIMIFWLQKNIQNDLFDSIRISTFNITSILTGTGYTTSNYNVWGGFGFIVMLSIMFIGGSAGSTTGGIKVFRLLLLFRMAKIQIKKLTHPHGVFITSFNSKPVGEDTLYSIMVFFFIYIIVFIFSAILLSFFNLDLITALSAAASAISNVGPGLGDTIGPNGNYSTLEKEAKWILSITMIIGRLELFTFLALISISFWKK